jgi:putative salt-induced outer membrane protein YdiY
VLLSATLPNQSVTDEQALADKVRRLEAQLAKTQAQLKNTQQQLTDLKTEKKAVTQPKKIAKTSRWKGTNASLGGVINTGNNTQQNLNSNLDINYKTSRWAYNSAFKVQYNRSSDK